MTKEEISGVLHERGRFFGRPGGRKELPGDRIVDGRRIPKWA